MFCQNACKKNFIIILTNYDGQNTGNIQCIMKQHLLVVSDRKEEENVKLQFPTKP